MGQQGKSICQEVTTKIIKKTFYLYLVNNIRIRTQVDRQSLSWALSKIF